MGYQVNHIIGPGPRHLSLPQALIRSEPGGGRQPSVAACPDQRARAESCVACLLICGHQGLLGPEAGLGAVEGSAWACPCLGPEPESWLGKSLISAAPPQVAASSGLAPEVPAAAVAWPL